MECARSSQTANVDQDRDHRLVRGPGARGLRPLRIVALLVAALFAGATAMAQNGKTLVLGANFVIQSLDPGHTIETTSNMVNHSAYDSLTTFEGEDLKTPMPSLATSWSISPDGTTYTFDLRQGVTFASGNPLTSADVKWSFDRVMNLKSNPAFMLEAVKDVQAPDPQTVVIDLEHPFPALLAILSSPALGILDSELVKQHGGTSGADAAQTDTAESFLNGQSAGSGPYMMTGYTPDEQVVLDRNPNYWGEAPAFERIVVKNITEAASQKLQLQKGDIQIATGISQDQVPSLEQDANVSVKSSAAATTNYLLMNNDPDVGGPFADPNVQKAVRYALDYDGILQLLGTGATRLAGIIPKNFAGALPDSEAVSTDPEKAKSVLADAGMSDVQGELSYATGSVIWGVPVEILAQKVQADLAAVGINVSLDGLPRAAALQKYREGKDQLGLWSWAADYPSPIDFLVYAPGGVVGLRAGWPADASSTAQDIADLSQQASMETDDAKRAQLLEQVNRQLAEAGPYAPMFQPAALYAFRSDLDGVTFSTIWGVDFKAVKPAM